MIFFLNINRTDLRLLDRQSNITRDIMMHIIMTHVMTSDVTGVITPNLNWNDIKLT